MTKLQGDAEVTRETAAQYRGRSIVVTVRRGVIVYRLKGTQQSWTLDHEVGLECAMKMEARDKGIKV